MTVRVVRALWSMGWLVTLLVGLPVALVRWVGWPLPDTDDLARWVFDPLTVHTGTAVLATAGWLLWAALLWAVAAEVTTRVTRRRLRHRIGGPLHATAAGLVGAVVVGTAAHATPTTHHPVAGDPSVAASSTTPAAPTPADADEDGWQVPGGGWLTAPAAAAAGGLAGAVWAHRRRHYQPHPPRGAHRDDPDLTSLPLVVTAVAHAPDHPADDRAAPCAGDVGGLPAGRLALTGPGAADAARGLLITTLLAGGSMPRTVTTTPATLAVLLPPATDRVSPAGLTVTDDLWAATTAPPTALLTAPLVILTGPPPAGWTDPAATVVTVHHRNSHDGHPVPGMSVWHVDVDGNTSVDGASGPRLTVLPATAAADLLNALAETRPPTPTAVPADPDPVIRTPAPAPALATAAAAGPGRAAPHIKVLGEPQVCTAGGEPVPIARTAAVELLVYLALHRGGAPTTQILEALWPHVRMHPATQRLHTAVSALRRALRTAAGTDVLLRHGDAYRINPTKITVDLWQLHHHADQAATAPDTAPRTRALRQLVDAYTGHLATGLHNPWLHPHREAARRHVLDALTYLADIQPDPTAGLHLLHTAIKIDPLNENLYQRLMRAHAHTGDHAAVTHTLTLLTHRLADTGTHPNPTTVELAATLTTPT